MARYPIYGGPCGYRWMSEDDKDTHGCGLAPGHREEWESPEYTRHECTCGDVWMEKHDG